MELIKEIVFNDPPTKWTLAYKKPKFNKDGKLITHQDFYLTGNLFYSDRTSYHLTSKIIQESKEYLFSKMQGLPELEKIRLEFEYHHTKDIDLDNKGNYWLKLFLDILKTPTQRQINNQKKVVITTNTIIDDNTKYLDEIKLKFVKGEHKMIFRIFGIPKSTQEKLDLFYI